MTQADKAPLPDDYVKGWAAGSAHESKELRAHIAALEAEKVRLLENYEAAFNRGLDVADKLRHQRQQELLSQAIRNDKLEAENKRMREALSAAVAWLCPDETTSFEGSIEDWEELARAALAQTGGE